MSSPVSSPMSLAETPLANTLPAAILETVLTHLAALFLTGAAGDMTAAREAASQMLAAYHPNTEDELHLAANIIGFSFQALEALSQAATPGHVADQNPPPPRQRRQPQPRDPTKPSVA